MTDRFFVPFENDKYGNGILLEEYNGKWSLCMAETGGDGNVYKKWIYPQRYDKETKERYASDKTIPWSIRLGEITDAIDALNHFKNLLEEMLEPASPASAERTNAYDDDDIPF